jgi:deoxycytidylate deaminase
MDDDFLDIGYFHLAKNTAKFSDHRVRVGCVISNKKPIVAACNKTRTHPKYANPENSNRGSIHAECRAVIHSGRKDLTGYSIYVYREMKNGRPALARPCEHCLSILEEVGIRKIYYTIPNKPYWKMEYL